MLGGLGGNLAEVLGVLRARRVLLVQELRGGGIVRD